MNRRILTLVLAGVLALVGAGSVILYANHANSRALAGQKAVDVLIATKSIPAGTTAAQISSYVRSDRVPASSSPQHALRDMSGTDRTFVTQGVVQPGQVIISDMFGAKTAAATNNSGLAIPAGKMAVTVPLSINADVAGFVQPGSQIAIFDTFVLLSNGKDAGSAGGAASGGTGGSNGVDTNDYATKLLLARVPVLATSQAAPTPTASSTAAASSGTSGTTTMADTVKVLVTVAVDQADAERLVHIIQSGGMPYAALLRDDTQTSTSKSGVDNHGRLGPVFEN